MGPRLEREKHVIILFSGSRLRRSTHLCNSVLDYLLIGHIALVAYQQLVDTLGGVSVDLLQPLLDVVE